MEKLFTALLSVLILLFVMPGSASQSVIEGNTTADTQRFLGESGEYVVSNESASESGIVEGRYILEYDLSKLEDSLSAFGVKTPGRAHEKVKSALGSGDMFMSQASDKSQGRFLEGFENAFNGAAVSNVSDEKLKELKQLDIVRKVYPDVKVDVAVDDSTGFLDAPEAWNGASTGSNLTGEGVSIAVIDTGVNYSHPDLGGCSTTEFTDGECEKVVDGYDFYNDNQDPMDDNGHGTHVAGTAAGNGTLKGLAPGADVYAYKVLGSGGSGYSSDIIAGIDRAVEKDVDVISMSLGGTGTPSDPMSQAVMNAVDNGVTPVIAAGNSGPSDQTIGSPGDTKDAITVGASYNQDSVSKTAQLNLTSPDQESFDTEFMKYSDYGNQRSYTVKASVVHAGNATQNVLGERDLNEKIAVFERTSGLTTEQQAHNLEEEGAEVAVTTDSFSDRFDEQVEIPVATLSNGDFSDLAGFAIDDEAKASVRFEMRPDRVASFSSRGPVISKEGSWTKPDVLAPGVSICAAQSGDYQESRTCTGENHIEIRGTSMATPHVSGIAALLLQKNPGWNSHQVKSALTMSADDLGKTYNNQGAGRVNITESLKIEQPALARLNTSGKVRGEVDIIGNVSGENIESWKLEIRPDGDEAWDQITNGTSQVEGVLKKDLQSTELEQGLHQVRLTVDTADGSREDVNYIEPSNIEVVTPSSGEYYDRDQIEFTGYATHKEFQNFTIQKREIDWRGLPQTEWNSENIELNKSSKTKEGGLLATWSPENGSKILELRLKVSTSEKAYTDNVYIYHDSMIAEGWPKQIAQPETGVLTPSYLKQPVAGNITEDEGLEIFSGYGKTVKLFNSTGGLKWEKNVNKDRNGSIQSSPVIADLNEDGRKEIAVGDTGGVIHAFNATGGYLSGYPVEASYDNLDAVAAADLLESQGKELVAGDWDGNVYILDQDGLRRELDPNVSWIDTVQTVADINSDGEKEVIATDYTKTHKVVALTDQGDEIWNYSVPEDSVSAAPVVTDLDFDGGNETVLASSKTGIDVLDSNGKSIEGFPMDLGMEISGFSFADVTGDGYLEIIVGQGEGLDRGFTTADRNGDKVEAYSRELPLGEDPRLGHLMVHGRGQKTTIFGGSYSGRSYRFEDDFSLFQMEAFKREEDLQTFPRYTEENHWKTGVVADITGDGKKEWLSVNDDMEAFLYETPVNVTSTPSWSTYQGGAENDGYYPAEQMPPFINVSQEKDEVLQGHTNNLTVEILDREGLKQLVYETNETGSWQEKKTEQLSGEETVKEIEWKNSSVTGKVRWRIKATDSSGSEETVTGDFNVDKHRAEPVNSITGNMTIHLQQHENGEIRLQTNETGTEKNRSFVLKEKEDLHISRSTDLKQGETLSYNLWEKIEGEWTEIREGLYPAQEMPPAIKASQETDDVLWEDANNLKVHAQDWKGLDTAVFQVNRSGWENVYAEEFDGLTDNTSLNWSNSTFNGDRTWRVKVNNTDGEEKISENKSFRSYWMEMEKGSIMEEYNFTASRPFDLSLSRPGTGFQFDDWFGQVWEREEMVMSEDFSSGNFSTFEGSWEVEDNTWKVNSSGNGTIRPRENASGILGSLIFDPGLEDTIVEVEYRAWNETEFRLFTDYRNQVLQSNSEWTNSSVDNSYGEVSWSSIQGTDYAVRSVRVYNLTGNYTASFRPRTTGNYSLNLSTEGIRDVNRKLNVEPAAPEYESINRQLMISAPRDIEIEADAPYIDLENSTVSVRNEEDENVSDIQIHPTKDLNDSFTYEEVPEGGCGVERYSEECTKINSTLNLSSGNYTINGNLFNSFGQNRTFEKDLEVLRSASIDPEVAEIDSDEDQIYLLLNSDNNSFQTSSFLSDDPKVLHPDKGFTYSGTIVDLVEGELPSLSGHMGGTYSQIRPSEIENLTMDVSKETKEIQGLKLDTYGIVKGGDVKPDSLIISGGENTSEQNVYGCQQMTLEGCESSWEKLRSEPSRSYETEGDYTGLAYGKPIQQDEDGEEQENQEEEPDQGSAPMPVSPPDPQPELEVTESSESVKITGLSENREIGLNRSNLPVTSVSFDQPGTNSSFEINSKEPETSLEVYRGFEVETDVEGITQITVKVDREWLEERKLKASDISLYRIGESEEDLGATVAEERPEKVIYESEVEEFSTLAVGSESACGNDEQVSAVVDGSCQVYDNACERPENSQKVDSCQAWREQQEIEHQIQSIEEESEEEEVEQKLREAEEALKNESIEKASEIVQEAREEKRQQEERQNEKRVMKTIFYGVMMILLVLVIVGIGFGGLYLYRKKRREDMARKLGQLTDSLHTMRDQGYRIAEQARKLEEANRAVENKDFSRAREITDEVKQDIRQKKQGQNNNRRFK